MERARRFFPFPPFVAARAPLRCPARTGAAGRLATGAAGLPLVALVVLSACCAPGTVPRSALDAMRATNNVFALAIKACDEALAARYTNQSDDAIARHDEAHFARLREAHVHRIEQLHGLRDLALFGERLLDMAEAGGTVLDELRAWARAMSGKLDALLVEVASAGAAIPSEATRAVLALRTLAEALR